jgi:hypothetical protein
LSRLSAAIGPGTALGASLQDVLREAGAGLGHVVGDLAAAAALEWDVAIVMDWSQGLALAAETRAARLCEVAAAVTLLQLPGRRPELRESLLPAYA